MKQSIFHCSNLQPMERAIRALAGTMVTLSVILAHLMNPYWLLLALFVGLNLLQSSVTRWCLAERILYRMGIVGGHKK
ncbi:MAG: DUF2892 domain-containing protein [Balneolaceae bacterium]